MHHLIITGTEIRQDTEGRYCLNDLHRAAGGENKHRPSLWLKNMQTMALIDEMAKAGITAIESKQQLGTFASKEIVYAYAMWISPAFNLKVIKTFDQQNKLPTDPFLAQLEMVKTVYIQQQELNSRVQLLEAKTITRDESYFTAAGFCNLKGIKLDRAGMAMVGKMAAQYSREHNLKMGKVYDSRYGEVNEYHTEALQYAVKA